MNKYLRIGGMIAGCGVVLLVCVAAVVPTRYTHLLIYPTDSSVNALEVYNTSGTSKFSVTAAGVTTFGGAMTFSSGVTCSSTLAVTGTTTLTGALTATSATFTGALILGDAAADTITVTGSPTFSQTSTFSGAVIAQSTVDITGATTIAGALTANGNVDLGNANTDTLTITSVIDGDLLFARAISGGADISVQTATTATAGDSLDLLSGAGGTAETNSDGQAGGALTLTAGAGSAKNGSGTNDGSGGDVVLLGGARGGSNGSAVQGIVRVGSPTVGGTKTTNYFAVAGGFEVDGAAKLDGTVALGDASGDTITVNGVTSFASGATLTAEDAAVFNANVDIGNANTDTLTITAAIDADILFARGITGGADISVQTATVATAGDTLDLVAGGGGTADTDADGQAGGAATITGGAGTAKNGSGTNDGSGGDVVLTGGARGGSNGSAVQGIVRVGSPTVGGTKTTNYLAVGGGFEVDGAARFDGDVTLGDNTSDTCTVQGVFKPRRISQAALEANDIATGELMVWYCTGDSKVYLAYKDTTGGIVSSQMAAVVP